VAKHPKVGKAGGLAFMLNKEIPDNKAYRKDCFNLFYKELCGVLTDVKKNAPDLYKKIQEDKIHESCNNFLKSILEY
jgi:hypothetical protein